MSELNYMVINRIFDGEAFIAEVKNALNTIVDNELLKDDKDIDFELIEECTSAILELENTLPDEAVYEFLNTDFFAKNAKLIRRGLSTGLRIALVAAVLIASSITVNAAVGSFTGTSIVENIAAAVNEKTEKKEKHKKKTAAEVTHNKEAVNDNLTTTETTTEKSNELTDKSVLISKGGMPEDNSFVICHEDYCDDNGNVHCSYRKVSSLGEEVKYKTEYTERVRNENTKFREEDYIRRNCQNSVCNEETGELHDFSDWYETQAPTCTDLGSKQRYCKVCGLKQECPLKATGMHLFVIKDIDRTQPNYDDYNGEALDGKINYVCEICGKKESKKIARAKYVVVDRYIFEYDGEVHHPKIIAVLDKNDRVIPKDEYTYFYFDNNGKGKDIYDDYGAYAVVRSDYQGLDVGLRYYYVPDTVKFKAILTGNGTIVPKWQKAKFCENVDRAIYEIQYSTNKDFSNAKTVEAYDDATKIVIDDVKVGETYYVRIRGVSDFSRYFSIPKGYWSDVRAVTVE